MTTPAETAAAAPFDPENDKLYTTTQVAETFGVTQETVRDWIAAKKLHAVRLGSGQFRVKRSVLIEFANHNFGIDSA